MYLNLVFHRVVEKDKDINDLYEITIDHFLNILTLIREVSANDECRFRSYRYYFDDGDDSFVYQCLPHLLKKELDKVILAIPTDNINREKFLTERDLADCQKLNIEIASHSVSHAALAFYANHKACPTPPGGKYQTSSRGDKNILSEQEVLYQMVESKKYLNNLGYMAKEFVLPHGCYNNDILRMNKLYNIYSTISTCDEFLDDGCYLRPRILISNDMSMSLLSKKVKMLKPKTCYD